MVVATKKTEAKIVIEPMKILDMTLHIVGTTPLLVHKFSEKAKKEMLQTQTGGKTKKKEWRSPTRDFIEALYWYNMEPIFNYDEFADLPFEQREEELSQKFQQYLDQGATFGFPTTGLKKAMASGGYRAKVTKDKVSIFGAFHILGELIELRGKAPILREDTVRLSNGSSDLRYRPFFTEWEADIPIQYNSDVITSSVIANLLNIAGFAVGIGENRPEKGGQFGRFNVGNKKK